MKNYIITIKIKSRSLGKAYELLKKLLGETRIVAFKMEYLGAEK